MQYDDFQKFEDNLAIIKKGDKWGVINKQNKIVIPIQYDKIYLKFTTLDVAEVRKDGKNFYINKQNKIVDLAKIVAQRKNNKNNICPRE
ncbi:MAG: WG repeat-containing protein [Moraxellaceae bacterium]|nr:WG repeat-containing protein [Moraxellaceae bacterium]